MPIYLSHPIRLCESTDCRSHHEGQQKWPDRSQSASQCPPGTIADFAGSDDASRCQAFGAHHDGADLALHVFDRGAHIVGMVIPLVHRPLRL